MRGLYKIFAVILALTLTGCATQKNIEPTEPTAEAMATVPTLAPPETTAPPETEPVDPVAELLGQMTTEEKVGQLLMQAFRSEDEPITTLTDEVRAQISDYHLGGVALFNQNITTVEDTTKFISDMQEAAGIPLIIAADEEGGAVSRLNFSDVPHETIPAAGVIPSNEEAYRTANEMGETLLSLGINVDFAPVADVNTNPNNPVIGTRAYSPDAKIAAERVTAAIAGLHDTGVGTAAKHFPGHGDTATDTHFGTASVTHDLDRLRTVEFLPFQAAVDAGVEMVMVGHIGVPNVAGNDIPASLNADIVSLVRSELGFERVIITDAMNMGAIVDNFGSGESAVMAVEAGIDIVLMPDDLGAAYDAIYQAVEDGRITQEHLDASVTRVLQLKMDLGIM